MAVVTYGAGAGVTSCHHIWALDETRAGGTERFPVGLSLHPSFYEGSWDARIFPTG